MRFWAVCSWNGDLRLEPDDDGKATKIVIYQPTSEETALVNKFLKHARKKKWLAGDQVIETTKNATILLDAPLIKAGPAFTRMIKPSERTLTAVRFSGGKVEVEEHVDKDVLEDLVAKGVKDPAATAATVSRPTPSCPQCLPGAIEPATEVLLSFLDEQQHADWARDRAIVVRGARSGHSYLLAHRHSQLAIKKLGRICYDLDDRAIVHFHDWSLPPEEEVLAAKLILEHREPWLRNEATCFGAHRDVFKNPFGDMMDGTESHAAANAFGRTIQTLLG